MCGFLLKTKSVVLYMVGRLGVCLSLSELLCIRKTSYFKGLLGLLIDL